MEGKLDSNFWTKVEPYSETSKAPTLDKVRRPIQYNPKDPPGTIQPPAKSKVKPEQLKLPFEDNARDCSKEPPNNTSVSNDGSSYEGYTTAGKQSMDIPLPIKKSSVIPLVIGLTILAATYFYTRYKQKKRDAKEKLKEPEEAYRFQKKDLFENLKKTDLGKDIFFVGEWLVYLLLVILLFIVFGILVKSISTAEKNTSN